jgi:tetratricopeptide (TPR) repeat protein
VRITAQLVQVATDSHLWSETYDRELEDIFAVQDDIAQAVVKELRAALLGGRSAASSSPAVKEEVRAAGKGRGENVETYRLYLQGRFFEDRFTREDTERALDYYSQALKIDPNYALAWAGIARAYFDQAGSSWLPIAEGFANAREAAQRALELDPNLPEAHAAMGAIRMFHDFDWKGADQSLKRALELAPGDARALRNAGVLARFVGQLDKALELLRRAATLDPLGVSAQLSLARTCHAAGLFDEAEAAASKAVEINPHGTRTQFVLAIGRLGQGRVDEAQAAIEREVHPSFRLLGLVIVHRAHGREAASRAALRELIDTDADGSAYQVAVGYAYRGETDSAFEWLEHAYRQRDPGVATCKLEPFLRSLHGDPRWQTFLKKMGLAD